MTRKICGIYCIENILDGKKYIGKSTNFKKRIISHKFSLRLNKESEYIQHAWNKYGEDSFRFYMLIECISDDDLLDQLEIFYIKYLHSHASEWGYNLSWGGSKTRQGMKSSEETKRKQSDSLKGKPLSEQTKNKMSLSTMGRIPWNKGIPRSEQEKENISKSKMGIPLSENHKQRISKGQTGLVRSRESRKNMVNAKSRNRKEGETYSQYMGVRYIKTTKKWTAYTHLNGKTCFLGSFVYEIEAAMAYNEAELDIRGYNALLNNITQEQVLALWKME